MVRRLLLLALWASAAAGCKKPGGPDSVKLSDVELPGLTVALPEGVRNDSESREVGAGGIEVKRGSQPRMTELRWSTLDAALTRDELVELMRESVSAQLGRPAVVDFGPALPGVVCGGPSETSSGLLDGKRVHLTSWYRPEEKRFFYLTTLADDEGGVVHRRVMASVRCGTVPPRALRSEIYPLFTPPPGLGPSGIKDGAQAFGGPDESFVFTGAEGKLIADAAMDADGGLGVGTLVVKALERREGLALDPASAQVMVDADGVRRVVVRGEPIIDGVPMQLAAMYWYCDKIGRSFVGIYMKVPGGDGGTIAGGVDAMLGARCPARPQ